MYPESDEDVRTILREAVRRGPTGVTIIGLCWDWGFSLRRVLYAVNTGLARGWLVPGTTAGVYVAR